MRSFILTLVLSVPAAAQTISVTPNLGLYQIPDGYLNWGQWYRADNTKLDNWSATVALKQNPVFTGIVTFPVELNGCLQATAGVVSATSCGGSQFITSLTTTGSSGAATVTAGVLNIPNYSTSG